MGVYKRGNIYYIDYYVNGKRIREKIGKSKTLAKKALESRKGEVVQEKYKLPQKRQQITFEKFTEIYLEYVKGYKKSWKSDAEYIKKLTSFFRGKRLDNINSFIIEKYKIERKKTVKPSSVNRELACLKYMYNMAIKWGYTENNPAHDVKLFRENNKRLRFLSKDEEKRLIDCSNKQLRPIIITALNTGMRRGEILGLMWEDIDFKNWIITIRDTKNGENRKIPMNKKIRKLFKDLKTKGAKGYIFTNKKGERIKSIKRSFHTALKKAEIDDFHFHDLRHTFASNLVMGGIDLVTVKELLGHKSISMTMRYSHLSQGHKLEAVEILDDKKAENIVTIWSQEQNNSA